MQIQGDAIDLIGNNCCAIEELILFCRLNVNLMERKFSYHFDDEKCVLFKTYFGPITIEDINSSWEFAFRECLIPKEKKWFCFGLPKGLF